MACWLEKDKAGWLKLALGGDRTLDLRIYSSTAYKYDALTNWATRAVPHNAPLFSKLVLSEDCTRLAEWLASRCWLLFNVDCLPSIFSFVVILGSQCPKYCKISLWVSMYVLFMVKIVVVVVVG